MKRIVQENNKVNTSETFESLKPLYGSKGNPPYYDPNDLHAHIWKKGKLGIEDNPKIPTYAKGKLAIKDCVYCKICHLVKDSFQSTVGSNKDVVDDILLQKLEETRCSYIPLTPEVIKKSVEIIKVIRKNEYNSPLEEIHEMIFYGQEGIFGDYVEITK